MIDLNTDILIYPSNDISGDSCLSLVHAGVSMCKVLDHYSWDIELPVGIWSWTVVNAEADTEPLGTQRVHTLSDKAVRLLPGSTLKQLSVDIIFHQHAWTRGPCLFSSSGSLISTFRTDLCCYCWSLSSFHVNFSRLLTLNGALPFSFNAAVSEYCTLPLLLLCLLHDILLNLTLIPVFVWKKEKKIEFRMRFLFCLLPCLVPCTYIFWFDDLDSRT